MIQVTRSGVRLSASEAELDAAAATFAATHLLRLPHFFDAGLGDLVERRLQRRPAPHSKPYSKRGEIAAPCSLITGGAPRAING